MEGVPIVDIEGTMTVKLLERFPPKEAQRLIELIPDYFEHQEKILAAAPAEGFCLTEEMMVCKGLSATDVAVLYEVEHEVLDEYGSIEHPEEDLSE